MRPKLILVILLAFSIFTFSSLSIYADQQACNSKGDFIHCNLSSANKLHVSIVEEYSRNKCEKGYSWGTDSHGIWVDHNCKAMFQMDSSSGHHSDYENPYKRHNRRSGSCPQDVRGNECEYFKDGYRAGKEDGKMSMSRLFERHSDSYDSRFKSFFADGYNNGWNDYR